MLECLIHRNGDFLSTRDDLSPYTCLYVSCDVFSIPYICRICNLLSHKFSGKKETFPKDTFMNYSKFFSVMGVL